jgi:Leucine-rich repeat (LRR) protein
VSLSGAGSELKSFVIMAPPKVKFDNVKCRGIVGTLILSTEGLVLEPHDESRKKLQLSWEVVKAHKPVAPPPKKPTWSMTIGLRDVIEEDVLFTLPTSYEVKKLDQEATKLSGTEDQGPKAEFLKAKLKHAEPENRSIEKPAKEVQQVDFRSSLKKAPVRQAEKPIRSDKPLKEATPIPDFRSKLRKTSERASPKSSTVEKGLPKLPSVGVYTAEEIEIFQAPTGQPALLKRTQGEAGDSSLPKRTKPPPIATLKNQTALLKTTPFQQLHDSKSPQRNTMLRNAPASMDRPHIASDKQNTKSRKASVHIEALKKQIWSPPSSPKRGAVDPGKLDKERAADIARKLGEPNIVKIPVDPNKIEQERKHTFEKKHDSSTEVKKLGSGPTVPFNKKFKVVPKSPKPTQPLPDGFKVSISMRRSQYQGAHVEVKQDMDEGHDQDPTDAEAEILPEGAEVSEPIQRPKDEPHDEGCGKRPADSQHKDAHEEEKHEAHDESDEERSPDSQQRNAHEEKSFEKDQVATEINAKKAKSPDGAGERDADTPKAAEAAETKEDSSPAIDQAQPTNDDVPALTELDSKDAPQEEVTPELPSPGEALGAERKDVHVEKKTIDQAHQLEQNEIYEKVADSSPVPDSSSGFISSLPAGSKAKRRKCKSSVVDRSRTRGVENRSVHPPRTTARIERNQPSQDKSVAHKMPEEKQVKIASRLSYQDGQESKNGPTTEPTPPLSPSPPRNEYLLNLMRSGTLGDVSQLLTSAKDGEQRMPQVSSSVEDNEQVNRLEKGSSSPENEYLVNLMPSGTHKSISGSSLSDNHDASLEKTAKKVVEATPDEKTTTPRGESKNSHVARHRGENEKRMRIMFGEILLGLAVIVIVVSVVTITLVRRDYKREDNSIDIPFYDDEEAASTWASSDPAASPETQSPATAIPAPTTQASTTALSDPTTPPSTSSPTEAATTREPTFLPALTEVPTTQAPTFPQVITDAPIQHLQTLPLPDYTLTAMEDPLSPQSRAYDWLMDDPLLTTYDEWRKLQRFALAAFYFSFNGDEWPHFMRDGWLEYGGSECDWFSEADANALVPGQTTQSSSTGEYTDLNAENLSVCNEQGRYRSLGLYNGNAVYSSFHNEFVDSFVGTMPPEVALLSSLERISIHTDVNILGISMADLLPMQFQSLTNLTTLDLSRCYFQDWNFAVLPYLDKLQVLDLAYSEFRNNMSSQLGLLSKLSHLDLSNAFGGTPQPVPSELGMLTALRYLDLSQNYLMGSFASDFQRLTLLQELYMRATQIQGFPPSNTLSNLQVLDMAGNSLAGSLPRDLSLFSSMMHLDLSQNVFTGPIPPELGMLTRLKFLDIHDNMITGTLGNEFSSLRRLTSLGELDLHQNNFNGSFPLVSLAWAASGALSHLDCGFNSFSGSIASELGWMTDLQRLYLNHNRLMGTLPSEIGLLSTNLEELQLERNLFRGSIPSQIGMLNMARKDEGIQTV